MSQLARSSAFNPFVVDFLPKLLIIERFKPFFDFVAVFEFLHVPIVPELGFNNKEKSPENLIGGSTA